MRWTPTRAWRLTASSDLRAPTGQYGVGARLSLHGCPGPRWRWPTTAGVDMGSAATTLSSRTISSGTLRARHLDGQHWVLELSGEADITTMDMLRRELAQVAIDRPCGLRGGRDEAFVLRCRLRPPDPDRAADDPGHRHGRHGFGPAGVRPGGRAEGARAAPQPAHPFSPQVPSGSVCGGELWVATGVGDHGAGDVAEPVLVDAGVVAHQVEGGVDADAVGSGQDALGLLDGDPAVQGTLQLFGEDLGAADGALLEEPDRGDVGQGTG